MPAEKIAQLNLMSKDAFSESFLGKFLLWALSIGRYVVVFTELVVILSFLSRFKLDRDLTDLNSRISQQVMVIESYGDLEERFRDLQARLMFMRTRIDSGDVMADMDKVLAQMPPDVRLTRISGDKEKITVSAQSLTSAGFYRFVSGLAGDRTFSDVKVAGVSSSDTTPGSIEFDLSVDLAQR